MSTIIRDAGIRIGGTQVLRNPDLEPLEVAQLKRFAPAIFSKSPIAGVSDKYGHVNTFDIIKAMNLNGYEIVEVRQSKRRDTEEMEAAERMRFTKHMLKFRKEGNIKKLLKVGDVVPQVVMVNSHDRSSGFHLYAGMFRLVCSNGLIVSDSSFVEPIKVRHTATMVEDIVNRSGMLIKQADGVYSVREDMLAVPLSPKEAVRFATKAIEFRPPRRKGLMTADTLLAVRREEDKPNDLWHVFNRVQENMMRGGNELSTEEGRRAVSRGIGRIERDVAVNSALWELAVDTLQKHGKPAPKKRAKATAEADI